jgi:cob(I)alamin adenosyltransferase
MKIYTKTGDAGETGLFGGARVSKASDRVDVYGEVDELNSVIGAARAHGTDPRCDALLKTVQSELFNIGAELACVAGKEFKLGVPLVSDAEITPLEDMIDALEADLQPLTNFVLPAGSVEASFLHIARTVCRRAERKLVALSQREPIRNELVRYLNRLSDLFFVMARHANHRANVADVPWIARTPSAR